MDLPRIRAELSDISKTADLHGQKLLAYLIEMAILEIDEQLSPKKKQPKPRIPSDRDGGPKWEGNP
jgi:hypothetical protein